MPPRCLPGLYYEPLASVGRLPVTEETEEGFREKLDAANPERQADAFLLDAYFGISPLVAPGTGVPGGGGDGPPSLPDGT